MDVLELSEASKPTRPRVSIIIPIYNAEHHLSASLESAAQQTFQDIEIICVDDGSADSSVQIVTDYLAADPRIRLLRHSKNKGEGASRNTGIDNALGDYIFHLDADDTLPASAIELLYAEARDNDSDMVKGGVSTISSAGELIQLNIWTLDNKVVNTNIHESRFLQSIPVSHCSYLYRRQLLNDNGIRYRTDLSVGLDLVALMWALTRAKTVTIIPQCVYNYRLSDNSVSRSHFSKISPIQAIWVKRILYEELNAIGLTQAGENIFKKWNFQLSNYWIRMPEILSMQDTHSVFSEFRAALPPHLTPWESNIGHHHRFILALVQAGYDDDAVEFLRTPEASKGFTDKEKLKSRLEFVLTVVPDDVQTLYELGCIALADEQLAEAALFFKKAIHVHIQHFDSRIALATLQVRSGLDSDAYATLSVEPQSKFLFENMLYTRRLLSSRNDWQFNETESWPETLNLSKFRMQANESRSGLIPFELDAMLKDNRDALEHAIASNQTSKNYIGNLLSMVSRLTTSALHKVSEFVRQHLTGQ